MNKMILVPHDIMGRDDLLGPIMSNLDKEINKILQDKSLPTDNKLLQYNQILHKYRKFTEERDRPYELEIKNIDSMTNQTPISDKGDLDDITLSTIPKKWRKNAKMLLDHVRNNPHMKWSEKGELIVEGNKIAGSNIVDLISDFSKESRTRKPAIGAEIFARNLLKENVPRESVVNRRRLEFDVDAPVIVASPPNKTPDGTPKSAAGSSTPKSGAKKQSVWDRLF